jgi:hypothetical protein
MKAFLKSMDSKTWKVVIKDWKHPVVEKKNGKVTTYLKLGEDWSKEEYELALRNFKALNVLFNGVDKNIFRLINTCTGLRKKMTTHEGTSKVKMSIL